MVYKINYVTIKKMESLMVELKKDSSLFIGELDGNYIQTKQQFLEKVFEVFKFPEGFQSIDAYLDWITDLDWLDKEGYVFIIYHVSEFMREDLKWKVIIIREFEEMVFPWWSGDVEKYSVGGKAKPFTVYLVD